MKATARPAKPLKGSTTPRIAPPLPARHDVTGFRESAESMGITLMPWQEQAARYLTAKGPDSLAFREVCIVVARQNGKTTLMKPLIVRSLLAGRKVAHIANNRELPRHMFGIIADVLSATPELLPKRRGRTIWPRYGAGQEEILLENGGSYRIAAAGRGSGRGWMNDLVIIDELREMKDFEVIAAAEPTLMMSTSPQIVYLSNMGDHESVVLNEVSERAGADPTLAYLEWSAAPERDAGDVAGWAESNPALGYYPSVMKSLEASYLKAKLSGNMAIFETEHLCRRVVVMEKSVVEVERWRALKAETGEPLRPTMAVSMDPSGERASAVIAWREKSGDIACRVHADVTGSPIDLDRLGPVLAQQATRLGVVEVAFDDWTDRSLARYFRKSRSINGRDFANASGEFVRQVEGGRLRWNGSDHITDDLAFTARRPHESGAWQAVAARDDRPVTAALAAIRAVWLASSPKLSAPRVL